MKLENSNSLDSNVYERIGAIPLSHSERSAAIAALEDGERIADGILAIAHVIRLFFTMPGLKPDFKH